MWEIEIISFAFSDFAIARSRFYEQTQISSSSIRIVTARNGNVSRGCISPSSYACITRQLSGTIFTQTLREAASSFAPAASRQQPHRKDIAERSPCVGIFTPFEVTFRITKSDVGIFSSRVIDLVKVDTRYLFRNFQTRRQRESRMRSRNIDVETCNRSR